MRRVLVGLTAIALPLSAAAAQEIKIDPGPTARALRHCEPATVEQAMACYDNAYTDGDKAIIRPAFASQYSAVSMRTQSNAT